MKFEGGGASARRHNGVGRDSRGCAGDQSSIVWAKLGRTEHDAVLGSIVGNLFKGPPLAHWCRCRWMDRGTVRLCAFAYNSPSPVQSSPGQLTPVFSFFFGFLSSGRINGGRKWREEASCRQAKQLSDGALKDRRTGLRAHCTVRESGSSECWSGGKDVVEAWRAGKRGAQCCSVLLKKKVRSSWLSGHKISIGGKEQSCLTQPPRDGTVGSNFESNRNSVIRRQPDCA